MIIALHGDLACPQILERDMGDLSDSVDLFFDARGWRNFDESIGQLVLFVASLPKPPIVVGYSRGGSAIARLSELVPLAGAVLYESPVIDSEATGGDFPVLMIWNDRGAAYGLNRVRRGQAQIAMEIWREGHEVTRLTGHGRHLKVNPLGHDWDVGLNDQIRQWIAAIRTDDT